MSPSQIKSLNGRLWPAACKAQGWPRKDKEAQELGWASERAFRLKTLGDILGRELSSSSDIGMVEEFTQVKDRLLMLADNLKGAAEDGDAVPNALRTRRWVALRDIKCLLIYVKESYVRAILAERFERAGVCHTAFDALPLPKVIEEFDDVRVLDELLSTLGQRLHAKGFKRADGTWRRQPGKRVAAGHTLHQMRTLAGVQCDCKGCAGRVPVGAESGQQTADSEEPVAVGAEGEPF